MKTARKSFEIFDPFRVKPFPGQPRKRFSGIAKLAKSIELAGQRTPIVVMPCDEKGFDAELIDGERRLQACRSIKRPIEAVVKERVAASVQFEMSVASNFCREGHDCVETMESIMALRDAGRSVAEVAGICGKSECWVYQHLSLARLHPEVRRMLERPGDDDRRSKTEQRKFGKMTFQLALRLVSFEPAVQLKAATHIRKKLLSLEASRHYVDQLGHVAGHVRGRREEPKARFRGLWNRLDRFRRALDEYADMPHTKLEELLGVANARERTALAGQIDDMAEVLKILSAELKKAAKK